MTSFDQIDWLKWAALATLVGVNLFMSRAWERHSAETANLPARRTMYDFLQTNPRVFYAAAIAGLAVAVLAKAAK